MNVIIPITVLFSLLCLLQRNKEHNAKVLFLFALSLLCILLSIRYEFGPDYFNYRKIYFGIQGEDVTDYSGAGSTTEVLFLQFLQLFPKFTVFVVTYTILWFVLNLLYIKKYILPQYYWLVLLFMLFNSHYIMGNMVAMRTALCSCLFLIALFFLLKGKRLLYIVIILLASLIHSSSIILILFVFFASKNSNSLFFKPWFAIVSGIISLLIFVSGENFVMTIINNYFVDNIDSLQHYSNYELGRSSQSLNTLLFKIMSFIILLYLVISGSKEKDSRYIVLYKVGIIVALLQLIFGQNILVDRFSMILNPAFIIALTRSIKSNKPITNIIVLVFVFVISFYVYYSKMSQEYSESFKTYQTILSAPIIP